MVEMKSLARIIADVSSKLVTQLYVSLPPLTSISAMWDSDDIKRDTVYLIRRIESEGISLTTVVLPGIGRRLDRYLEKMDDSYREVFQDCSFKTDHDGIPLFLNAVWRYVLLGDDDDLHRAKTLKGLRTLLYLWYKLELPYTAEQEAEKLLNFRLIEAELPVAMSEVVKTVNAQSVLSYAEYLVMICLRGLNVSMINPRHGPGAVATGEKGNRKWAFTHLYDSLHQQWPYYNYMYGLRSDGRATMLAAQALTYRRMQKSMYPVSKCVFVPKDSRGPRLITAEPLELQFVQQGVMKVLVDHLEKRSPVRGHVNFDDQTINQHLALQGSISGSWATLDLSDASDRVSVALFQLLFPETISVMDPSGDVSDYPLRKKLLALRSHATILPDGEEIVLKKFAAMGNALCFPIESLIFFALSYGALRASGVHHDRALRSVYVYGDDIIVPTNVADLVHAALENFGLKVNTSKCFMRAGGFFRESCGVDAWKGNDVTPLKIKSLPPVCDSLEGSSLSAWADYVSWAYAQDMPVFAEALYKVILDSGVKIPLTPQKMSYLSVVHPTSATHPLDYSRTRWNTDLQRWEVRALAIKPYSKPDPIGDWSRLNKGILMPGEVEPDKVVARRATQIVWSWEPSWFSLSDWLAIS